MSHRDFEYVGDPIPELTSKDNSAFLMLIQEAILLSLKDKELLTCSQYERCLNELNGLNKREHLKRRQAR